MHSDEVRELLAGRHDRAQQYFQAAAEAAETWYNDQGEWVLDEWPSRGRDRLWLSFALYSGNEKQQRLADAVVLGAEVEAFEDGHHFNIFQSNIAPIVYADFHDRMSVEAAEYLLALTTEGHHNFPGDRQCDYQFHGYNDNMPADGTMSLIIGGELVEDEEAVAHGRWQLRQFQEQLHRGGLIAEYNSPTYVPLTLHAMAAIAELASSEEDRETARLIERRIWADLACHWHPESKQLAGPHSRAYTTDVVGHLYNVRSVAWLMFGDQVAGLSPMSLFDPPENIVYHHCGNMPFNISQMCWFIAGHYHLETDIAQLFVEKRYPFELKATSEQGDSQEMPSRRTLCTTYLTKDYALGTSTVGYGSNGQADNFYVTFPREGQEPVGSTVYCRYHINDDYPGMPENDGHWVGEANHVPNHSNSFCLQDGPTCLYSAHPYLALADQKITRLRMLIIFPTHLGEVEQIQIGDRPVTDWEGEYDLRQWVGVRAGRCLLGFRPLAYSAVDLEPRLLLESYPNYRAITIENYCGKPRSFSEEELRNIFNGFVAEVASVGDYASLADFLEQLKPAELEDYAMFRTRRLRYVRPARPGAEATELATSYTVRVCSPRFATINGQEIQLTPWQATGLSAEEVSVMPGPYQPQPSGLPWESLEVYWYPEDRWAINESGQ